MVNILKVFTKIYCSIIKYYSTQFATLLLQIIYLDYIIKRTQPCKLRLVGCIH